LPLLRALGPSPPLASIHLIAGAVPHSSMFMLLPQSFSKTRSRLRICRDLYSDRRRVRQYVDTTLRRSNVGLVEQVCLQLRSVEICFATAWSGVSRRTVVDRRLLVPLVVPDCRCVMLVVCDAGPSAGDRVLAPNPCLTRPNPSACRASAARWRTNSPTTPSSLRECCCLAS
jgi:hypothetical protein